MAFGVVVTISFPDDESLSDAEESAQAVAVLLHEELMHWSCPSELVSVEGKSIDQ